MKHLWKLALVSVLVLIAACNGQRPNGTAQIVVDNTLTPTQLQYPARTAHARWPAWWVRVVSQWILFLES